MEVFPPKTGDKFESIRQATEEIAALKPDFMSVTYGAGGGTSEFTADIAANIQEKYVDFSVTGNKRDQTYNIIFTFKSMLDASDIIHFYNECNLFFQFYSFWRIYISYFFPET